MHDVDSSFVPRFFVFAGSFLSPIKKVLSFDERDPSEPGYMSFRLEWIGDRYFVVYDSDVVYDTEVMCWIEQFVGRALRVSRMYGVSVVTFIPRIFVRAVSVYLLAVVALPSIDDVYRAFEEIERMIKKEKRLIEKYGWNKEFVELRMKAINRLVSYLIDVEELFEKWDLVLGTVVGPRDVRRVLPHLYSEVLSMFKEVF